MTHIIDLPPEIEALLKKVAANHSQNPTEYLRSMVIDSLILTAEADQVDAGWNSLNALINRCQIETGVTDLAHQHDHYIHGKPKREN